MAGPPGCTHRPAELNLWTSVLRTPSGKTTSISLPSRKPRGLRGVEVRTKSASRCQRSVVAKTRSSPVYTGHTIKPLKKHHASSQAPAVSDRTRIIRQSRRTPLHSTAVIKASPSLRSDPIGYPRKGMISSSTRLSECKHGRASDGQHARRPLFSRSGAACQEQNSDQF